MTVAVGLAPAEEVDELFGTFACLAWIGLAAFLATLAGFFEAFAAFTDFLAAFTGFLAPFDCLADAVVLPAGLVFFEPPRAGFAACPVFVFFALVFAIE